MLGINIHSNFSYTRNVDKYHGRKAIRIGTELHSLVQAILLAGYATVNLGLVVFRPRLPRSPGSLAQSERKVEKGGAEHMSGNLRDPLAGTCSKSYSCWGYQHHPRPPFPVRQDNPCGEMNNTVLFGRQRRKDAPGHVVGATAAVALDRRQGRRVQGTSGRRCARSKPSGARCARASAGDMTNATTVLSRLEYTAAY